MSEICALPANLVKGKEITTSELTFGDNIRHGMIRHSNNMNPVELPDLFREALGSCGTLAITQHAEKEEGN